MGKETGRSAEMGRVIEEYARSGLGREQCGIALTTFDYWRRELRGKLRMVKVKVAASDAAVGHFMLILGNGQRIESEWRFTDTELARLIRVVESV